MMCYAMTWRAFKADRSQLIISVTRGSLLLWRDAYSYLHNSNGTPRAFRRYTN